MAQELISHKVLSLDFWQDMYDLLRQSKSIGRRNKECFISLTWQHGPEKSIFSIIITPFPVATV